MTSKPWVQYIKKKDALKITLGKPTFPCGACGELVVVHAFDADCTCACGVVHRYEILSATKDFLRTSIPGVPGLIGLALISGIQKIKRRQGGD